MPRLDPTARVRNHIEEVLADGPVPFDDLRDALMSRGLELGPDPDERVYDVLGAVPRVDFLHKHDPDDGDNCLDLCFDRLALVDGVTWTVPISELDLASDTVPPGALGLLFMPLLDEWCTLEGGDSIDIDADDRRRTVAETLGVITDGGIAFPEGWLAEHGAKAGGFLLLRLDGDTVRAEGADEAPAVPRVLVDALLDTLGPESSTTACRTAVQMLTEAFVLHPELRGTQVPALAQLIEAAGLIQDGNYLARADFDFEREKVRRQIQDVVEHLEFREPEVQAYATLAVAWHEWMTKRDEVEPELLAAAAASLDLVPVAVAFADQECDPEAPEGLDDMVSFGEALIATTRGRRRAGPAWLVAHALGVAGFTDRFEDWIDTALMSDDDHILALHDKAWFEFDRGEASKAKALLTRIDAGAFAHDLEILDAVLGPTRPAVRRNDPCPCGSGRKFKHCHLGVEEVPLDARLTWLYRKANWWLDRRHRPEVQMMAWLSLDTPRRYGGWGGASTKKAS